MTFLDQRVADETAFNKLASRIGIPIIHRSARMGVDSLKIPMELVTKMSALVNDKRALSAFFADRTSAENRVSLTFLDTYPSAIHALEPKRFDVWPVLLTQPAEDIW